MTGLEYALCAFSYFRHRHDRVKVFKRPRKESNKKKTFSMNRAYCQRAREYIRQARAAGWRGSVIEAAMKKYRAEAV